MRIALLNTEAHLILQQRLIEAEVFYPDRAYGLLEFMDDVKQGVWRELSTAGPIDTYRRNLQRGYLERMEFLMTEEIETHSSSFMGSTPVDVSQSDIRPLIRRQLKELRAEASRAAERTNDPMTRYHLEDVVVRIDRILEGEEAS